MKKVRHIYYFCPDYKKPSGGVRKIYKHVDILNKHNLSAYVLHLRQGFRCDWFKHSTAIAYPKLSIGKKIVYLKRQFEDVVRQYVLREKDNEIQFVNNHVSLYSYPSSRDRITLPKISHQDILVIPEFIAYQIYPSLLNQPFVIFNQGAYITFNSLELSKTPFTLSERNEKITPYLSNNLLAVLAVSSNSMEYLRYAFPGLPLKRVHNAIDFDIFSYQEEKKKQIAFMPRRCEGDALQVVNLLKGSNRLRDWTFVPIEGMTEEQVAGVLKETAIFLSFSYEEGFSLPPAEAMASGCLVIGYHGQGAREYLKQPYAYPIEHSEITLFAKTIEKVALDHDKNPDFYREMRRRSRDFIRNKYSDEAEESDIIEAWNLIIDKHGCF